MKKCMALMCMFFILSISVYAQDITIIQTTDLHSHFLGFSPNIDYTPATINDDNTVGGWARIATVINDTKKSRKNPVLVLDSGDFLMGSLFHLLCREESFELRLMKTMGYDCITLGNHEFDLFPDGLTRIIQSAKRYNALPAIVASNVVFSAESKDDDSLEKVFEQELVKTYTVLQKGTLKIGLFGIIGKDAAEVSPFADPVTFADQVKTATTMVDILKNKEKVDVVICLSHSGIKYYKNKNKKEIDPDRSEDVQLAKVVNGIDVIISGHTHTKIPKPLIVNKTIITQSYEYGKQVAVLDCTVSNDGVSLKDYSYIDINDTIKGDAAITAMIQQFTQVINQKVLSPMKLQWNSILAKTTFNLTLKEDECNLGNLIADSIQWYVNNVDANPDDPDSRVTLGVISGGVIRDNLLVGKTGKVALCDAFAAIPLGIGMDDTMGYPLITCYLYASEIKKALEILTSIYPLKGSDYFIHVSGVKFTYNPNRMLFDRVTEIRVGDEHAGYNLLDYSSNNKKLYRVSADIYNATFLKIIGNFTWHILDIVPKWRDGKPIESLKDARVDADKKKAGIQELKEWQGVIAYIQSFKDEDGDGIPDIPAMYRGKLDRIVVEASLNPYSMLKRGTTVTWIGFVVFLFVLAIVGGIVYAVVKRMRR